MAFTAADLIARSRQILTEFDVNLIEDSRLFTELSDEVEKLVEEIIHWNNAAFPLPTNASESIDVSTYAESYDLDEDHWRPRRLTINYSSGRKERVQLVPEAHQYQVPLVFPSAVLTAAKLFPIDGSPADASDRVYGWSGANTVTNAHSTKPAVVSDGGTTVGAPDEAIQYLSYWLSHFMAIRAKAGEAINAIGEKVSLRKNELRQRVLRFGGPVTFRREMAE